MRSVYDNITSQEGVATFTFPGELRRIRLLLGQEYIAFLQWAVLSFPIRSHPQSLLQYIPMWDAFKRQFRGLDAKSLIDMVTVVARRNWEETGAPRKFV